MSRLLSVALVVVVLGAAGFGAAQLREARRLREATTALERERGELRRKLRELEKKNAELTARLAGTPDTGEPAAAAEEAAEDPVRTTATGADGGGPRSGSGPQRRRGLDLLNSPEAQQLMNLQQRGALDGRYAALFRHLNLSPAELERFKQLLVEKQAAATDVIAAARAEGLLSRENRDELRQLVQQSQAEVDAAIRAELGESVFAQYQNYEATLPQRGIVDQLERRLSYSPTPLSPAQAEQLVQILAATAATAETPNQPRVIGSIGTGPAPTNMFGGRRITDEALARAQGVLLPDQIAALQALQQEQRAAQQLQQQLRANTRAPRPSPAPPGGG